MNYVAMKKEMKKLIAILAALAMITTLFVFVTSDNSNADGDDENEEDNESVTYNEMVVFLLTTMENKMSTSYAFNPTTAVSEDDFTISTDRTYTNKNVVLGDEKYVFNGGTLTLEDTKLYLLGDTGFVLEEGQTEFKVELIGDSAIYLNGTELCNSDNYQSDYCKIESTGSVFFISSYASVMSMDESSPYAEKSVFSYSIDIQGTDSESNLYIGNQHDFKVITNNPDGAEESVSVSVDVKDFLEAYGGNEFSISNIIQTVLEIVQGGTNMPNVSIEYSIYDTAITSSYLPDENTLSIKGLDFKAYVNKDNNLFEIDAKCESINYESLIEYSNTYDHHITKSTEANGISISAVCSDTLTLDASVGSYCVKSDAIRYNSSQFDDEYSETNLSGLSLNVTGTQMDLMAILVALGNMYSDEDSITLPEFTRDVTASLSIERFAHNETKEEYLNYSLEEEFDESNPSTDFIDSYVQMNIDSTDFEISGVELTLSAKGAVKLSSDVELSVDGFTLFTSHSEDGEDDSFDETTNLTLSNLSIGINADIEDFSKAMLSVTEVLPLILSGNPDSPEVLTALGNMLAEISSSTINISIGEFTIDIVKDNEPEFHQKFFEIYELVLSISVEGSDALEVNAELSVDRFYSFTVTRVTEGVEVTHFNHLGVGLTNLSLEINGYLEDYLNTIRSVMAIPSLMESDDPDASAAKLSELEKLLATKASVNLNASVDEFTFYHRFMDAGANVDFTNSIEITSLSGAALTVSGGISMKPDEMSSAVSANLELALTENGSIAIESSRYGYIVLTGVDATMAINGKICISNFLEADLITNILSGFLVKLSINADNVQILQLSQSDEPSNTLELNNVVLNIRTNLPSRGEPNLTVNGTVESATFLMGTAVDGKIDMSQEYLGITFYDGEIRMRMILEVIFDHRTFVNTYADGELAKYTNEIVASGVIIGGIFYNINPKFMEIPGGGPLEEMPMFIMVAKSITVNKASPDGEVTSTDYYPSGSEIVVSSDNEDCIGWIVNGKTYNLGEKITLTENVSIIEKIAEKYSVTFMSFDEVVYIKTGPVGTSVDEPISPEHTDYTFVGWDRTVTEITDADIVVRAIWVAHTLSEPRVDYDGDAVIGDNDADGITITGDDLGAIVDSTDNPDENRVIIDLADADVGLSKEAVDTISEAAGSNGITITARIITDLTTLQYYDEIDADILNRIANGLAINVSVSGIDTSNLGNVRISDIKYTLGDRNANNVGVYYINENGDLEKIIGGYSDGKIWFETTHFSDFAIVYYESYTIEFDKNSEDATGTMENLDMVYDVEKSITEVGFVKTGHSLKGWATEPTGEVVYADGQAVKNLTEIDGGSVTLYAVWAPNSYGYTIKFVNEEGEEITTAETGLALFGSEVDYTLPVVSGYITPAKEIFTISVAGDNVFTITYEEKQDSDDGLSSIQIGAIVAIVALAGVGGFFAYRRFF